VNNGAFTPFGATVLVGLTEVQVGSGPRATGPTAYRIRNVSASAQYISWAPAAPLGGAAPSITVTAPTAGVPSNSTLGFLPNSVEVVGGLPANAFFKADAAGAFEVTPGEGL
jgi:hypothetical protein